MNYIDDKKIYFETENENLREIFRNITGDSNYGQLNYNKEKNIFVNKFISIKHFYEELSKKSNILKNLNFEDYRDFVNTYQETYKKLYTNLEEQMKFEQQHGKEELNFIMLYPKYLSLIGASVFQNNPDMDIDKAYEMISNSFFAQELREINLIPEKALNDRMFVLYTIANSGINFINAGLLPEHLKNDKEIVALLLSKNYGNDSTKLEYMIENGFINEQNLNDSEILKLLFMTMKGNHEYDDSLPMKINQSLDKYGINIDISNLQSAYDFSKKTTWGMVDPNTKEIINKYEIPYLEKYEALNGRTFSELGEYFTYDKNIPVMVESMTNEYNSRHQSELNESKENNSIPIQTQTVNQSAQVEPIFEEMEFIVSHLKAIEQVDPTIISDEQRSLMQNYDMIKEVEESSIDVTKINKEK